MSRRTHRMGDLLRASLAEVLRRDVSDPRMQLATVTEVDVSPDLQQARVMVSILGPDDEREASLAALNKAASFIRHRLAARGRLRATPELTFQLDRGAEYSRNIADLLEELNDDDERP